MDTHGPTNGDGPPSTLSSCELREYVQDVMDWNAYQAAAYVVVAQKGPLEPSEIVALTDVPQGRVYDIMGQLEGEAVNIQGHQPKRYAAQHPRSLLGDKRSEFNEKADLAIDHLEQQHEIQRERHEPRHPAWVIPGIGGTKRELLEGLDRAEERVLLLEEDGEWIQSKEIRDLGRLVTQGVEVELIGWTGWCDKVEQIAEDAAVDAWVHDRVDSSFAIIDDDLAILRVGRGATGVKLADAGSVKVLRRAFEAMKQDATGVHDHA